MNTTANATARLQLILRSLAANDEVEEAIETLTHALACHIADAGLALGKGKGIEHYQHVDALIPEVSSAVRESVGDIVQGLLDSPWYDAEGNVT